MMVGVLTPVQIEGLRLLLTPFPQEEFNQTEDRKSADQSLGVTCLDCHANFHTNAAFHQTPDVSAQRKGVHLPDRFDQVPMMAQMQNIIDFPPAPKLLPTGRLDPSKATQQELAGERVFMGKGRCAAC